MIHVTDVLFSGCFEKLDLVQKFRREKPRRVWISTRCTYWCPWTSLNYRTVEKQAVLNKYRRNERKMFKLLIPFIAEMSQEFPQTEFFWEWPTRCYGWNEPVIQELAPIFHSQDRDWLYCRIDGCRYDLRSERGNLLRKSWTIACSSPSFYSIYKCKTCTGSHEHEHIHGVETSRSAYYPWKMVKSIAQTWRQELYPDKWRRVLHTIVPQSMTREEQLHALQLFPLESDLPSKKAVEPDEKEVQLWKQQLLKFHKAAGHPNNYNLARIIREAGKERWQIEAAMDLKCDDCLALKPGSTSSGKVPPASMRPLPRAWEMVGMDTTEWTPHGSKVKLLLLILMDLATKFKVVCCLKKYPLYEMQHEKTTDLLDAFCKYWLADKPKPRFLIPDNAKPMISKQMRTVLSDMNIIIDPPPAKESWAHGLVERAVQEVKTVSSKLALSHPALEPDTVVALATHALNSTEYVHGYSSFQWVYGQQFTFTEEDEQTLARLSPDVPSHQFVDLLVRRADAEDIARKTRAQRVLTQLRNSKVRQPLQVFHPMDLVKIWRSYSSEGGSRGGMKKLGRPQWLGPGRVVFHEVVAGQQPQDDRRHIVWVVIGGYVHRCSVHSVRKVTERERLDFELTSPEDPSTWYSLKDMLPKRSYIDITSEEPHPDEHETVSLPAAPDRSTVAYVPTHRHLTKHGPRRPVEPSPHEPLNDYGVSSQPAVTTDDSGVLGNVPFGSHADSSSHVVEPESKKPRTEAEDELLFLSYMEQADEGYVLTVDIELNSQREKERFIQQPTLMLVQKLRDCEVRYEKLRPEHKKLFDKAKSKEVNSFISNAALRRCLDWEEEQEAANSGRVMRCRWVLTWKPTPDESLEEAQQEVRDHPDTTALTSDGKRKAKARIVLLGFEHPDLLKDSYKTSSPVQAVLTRNVSYQLVLEEGWDIEGMDMSTAFLQTLPSEESKRLWTYGVRELREALQVPEGGVLRILKNFYGSTSAPRNLWENVDSALKSLGAIKIKGDPCFWLWLEPFEDPTGASQFRPLGFMSGHVDDFHRAGRRENAKWISICEQIDKLYKWGSVKHNAYRHAGTDLQMVNDQQFGRCLIVDQQYYVETLQDVEVDPQRFSQPQLDLSAREVSSCRSSLGALQWLAVQTQPMICGRCNLLLTELSTNPKMSIAQEIQDMVRELRKKNSVLKFFKLPGVKHWTDLVVVGLGDQAHNNRPRGGSTGGMVVFLGGPDIS